jgi:hypothetical protein
MNKRLLGGKPIEAIEILVKYRGNPVVNGVIVKPIERGPSDPAGGGGMNAPDCHGEVGGELETIARDLASQGNEKKMADSVEHELYVSGQLSEFGTWFPFRDGD